MNKTFALISLGCAKNLVNSEQMLYLLSEAGYALVPEPEGADFAVVNTCGFIDAAKSEAIDTILELAELKKAGRLGALIVTGCLSERYRDSILEELPEIDAVLGVGSFGRIVEAADRVCEGRKLSRFGDQSAPVEEIPRVVTTGPGWAYLRIAEGCNNFCAFCAIPFIRGRYRSRTMENVLEEARDLAAHGVKELIVIAQDITRYGTDLYGKRMLAPLCRELAAIEGVEWIRLHYLYPDQFDDELIDEIARSDKIVKYLDIPIQHINDAILKRMNRRGTGAEIRALFRKLRERIPGLVLRTSLIAGLPGEGEAEFEELCAFLREAKIERVGVFPFSPEEGTPAALMERPDEETAQRRADQILELQAPIMDDFLQSFVGKTLRVLYEYDDAESGLHVGRSYADSPDIDGLVFFSGACTEGELVEVEIDETDDGYWYGHVKEAEA
ncbi:MAG: 30S ribosomal protein S12 methylthiotransferase RimO [Oscillospiraceae bacterium]|nr:30S ribosomal protein S12 methylthiotransferase RimO [Oscillospiraceae bacterium]